MHGRRLFLSGEPTYDLTQPKRLPRCRPILKMIKTFSISALFFMTIGVLLATHVALPF